MKQNQTNTGLSLISKLVCTSGFFHRLEARGLDPLGPVNDETLPHQLIDADAAHMTIYLIVDQTKRAEKSSKKK